jgi:hypothetical protein
MESLREKLTLYGFLTVVVVAVLGVIVSLFRYAAGPSVGLSLVLVLGASGLADTRVGMELYWIVGHLFDIPGINSSGRPGDDPLAGFQYFPWLLMSIATFFIAILAMLWVTMRQTAKKHNQPRT